MPPEESKPLSTSPLGQLPAETLLTKHFLREKSYLPPLSSHSITDELWP